MKRLEDIPKQNIFEVPDGYFDKLPQVIQARVAKPERTFRWLPMLKYAMPVAALLAISFYWRSAQPNATIEEQLSEIQTEQLMAYLENSEVSTEFITEEVTWSENDLNELENTVFSSMDFSEGELDEIADELIIESENM